MKAEKSNEIFVHVFFVDIVSLSDPNISSVEQQVEKIRILYDIIKNCKRFKSAFISTISTTGDGVAICFKDSIRSPLELAIEVQKKLRRYNVNKRKPEKIWIRIGINSGTILKTGMIGDKENYWGPGIVYAQRIMNVGEYDHILIEGRDAEELRELSTQYKNSIHYAGEVDVKHEVKMKVYSAYGDDFGNKRTPKKIENLMETITDGYGGMTFEPIVYRNKEYFNLLMDRMKIVDAANVTKSRDLRFMKPTKNKKRGKNE